MSKTLVERLVEASRIEPETWTVVDNKPVARSNPQGFTAFMLCDEASTRIERLEKALRSLRHTAEHGTPSGIPRPCTCRSCEVIRKAMEET